MKLIGSTKIRKLKITNLEITELVLIHCNIASNKYQWTSRILYKFVPNKLFGQLFDISP